MNSVRRQLIDITCKRQLSLSSFIKQQQQHEEHDDITHFGFENVRKAEKQTKVDEVFASVAPKYDIMNDIMSAGVHRLWKDHFISTLNPTSTTKLLDSAGGTGDIAFRYKNYCSDAQVTVCDINQNMLNVGKQRAQQLNLHDIQWVCASAEDLPFDDNTYNAYTISFGIRNCTNIDKVLSEAYRVLQPGGRFMCLEFSHVENIPVKSLYDWYSFNTLPVMGEVIAQDWKSYQYLAESIRKFPSQEHFKTMIEDAGFKCVTYQNLTFGVCAIHSGFKL